ncbi:MAG: hypothetical protein ABIF85_02075 [Nanoarchaeota archaeon]|nr:hypothetical protein [Nanoarchaeota archaeon]MBU4300869.1 hypothetical protein [Nanoarchaeota archaeon]MBU4451425.1 hypothetical protein [Nanoarchaeota archaeon]MCG2724501.1 hypothetical protein [archaeon]
MFENLALTDSMILVFILAAFLVIGYKVLSILKNVAIIAFLAYIFPLVLNNIFGASFQTGFEAQLHYVTIALGLYLVYEVLELFVGIGSIIFGIFEILAMPIVWIYDAIKALLGGKKKMKEIKKEKQKEKETNNDDENHTVSKN